MGPIPEGFTGIQLIDESKDFSKWNCRWAKRNVGRQSIPKKKAKKKKPRSLIKNPQPICLVLERNLLDYIKEQALKRSLEIGSYVEPNDMIRDAIKNAFPVPGEYDMFGTKLSV
jgi:hypothetical protein